MIVFMIGCGEPEIATPAPSITTAAQLEELLNESGSLLHRQRCVMTCESPWMWPGTECIDGCMIHFGLGMWPREDP